MLKRPSKVVLVRRGDGVVWSGFAKRGDVVERKRIIIDNIEFHSGLGRAEKDQQTFLWIGYVQVFLSFDDGLRLTWAFSAATMKSSSAGVASLLKATVRNDR